MNRTTVIEPQGRTPTARVREQRVTHRLGRYTEQGTGALREIVSIAGSDARTLVVDRLAASHADARLLAHLAPEEPSENARIVARMYLAEETRGGCRLLSVKDLELEPPSASALGADASASLAAELTDADGSLFRVEEIFADGSFPELRWTRSQRPSRHEAGDPVALREVIARFEDYEPARAITAEALAAHGHEQRLSTVRLRGELARVLASPIVLNRGLREAVQRELARGETTMSEIAIRCGRTKIDRRGNSSGETSWLARRIGRLPEGGQEASTPWIHTDVLALIAREGLGVSPNEVEL